MNAALADVGPVTAAELEHRLALLAADVDDPVAGLFGPGSALWRINRHASTFLGGGRAALLQVAHPAVAQAISHHSITRDDPYGRFQRTFRQVFPMVWGSLDEAFAAARAVHRAHQRIRGRYVEDIGRHRRGDPYDANDRGALLWVHATLWETSIATHETIFGPLDAATKNQYYRETKRFAALFGLDPAGLPADWDDFLAYNRRVWESDELAVGSVGREIAGYLFTASDPALEAPARWLRTLTAGFLPPPVREKFGFAFGAVERRSFDRMIAVLRRALPRLPARLRHVPPYFEARRRIAGSTRIDWVGRVVTRAYLGQ